MKIVLQFLAVVLLASILVGCGVYAADDRGSWQSATGGGSVTIPSRQPSPGSSETLPSPDAGDVSDPTRGLSLQIHLDPPMVPEQIRGPSPPIAGRSK